MSQEKFDDHLENPEAKVRSSNDLLLKAFWYIVWLEKITVARWHKSMREYVYNPDNGVKQTGSARTERRSNLRQSLVKDKITWMIFNRALKALGIKRAEIIVRYSFEEEGDNNMKEFPLTVIKPKNKPRKHNGRQNPTATETNDGGSESE